MYSQCTVNTKGSARPSFKSLTCYVSWVVKHLLLIVVFVFKLISVCFSVLSCLCVYTGGLNMSDVPRDSFDAPVYSY